MKFKGYLISLVLAGAFLFAFLAVAQEGFEFDEEEGFDFSTEEAVTAPETSGQPAGEEGLTFGAEEAVVGGAATAADKKKMQLGLDAIKEQKFMPGAVSMFDVLQTRAVELHQSAEYNLAKSLYKVKLYRASLHYFIKIAAAGEAHKHFESAFQWMLLLARNIGDKHKVIETLARFQNVTIPEKLRPEFAFYMTQHFVLRRNYDIARQYILQVEKGNSFYPKVRFLEGVIQFQEQNFEEAVETIKEVVNITSKGGDYDDPELRDNAFLVLARIHYAHKQFNAALFYYAKISQESPEWAETIFEGSWALYQLGRYSRSLGNILTLQSPYFKNYYNPESTILKAVNYYENCRYADAAAIVNEFIANYRAVYDELTGQLQKLNKNIDFYNFIIRSQAQKGRDKGDKNVFTRIVSLAMSDHEFMTLSKSISEIDEEIKKINALPAFFRSSPLGVYLLKTMNEDKNALKEMAGAAAKSAFQKETKNIQELLNQCYRIRLETTSKVREEQMALLRGRKLATEMKERAFSPAVGESYEYWPFTGEYWKDELGNYEYVLMRACRE